jgi:hypothetical protein
MQRSRFSEEQKRVALLLLHSPKTAEELNKQLNIPYSRLMEELKGMLKLKVVERTGFPTKYQLKQDIAQEVKKRQKISEVDQFKIRVKAFIEMQAIEEGLLQKQLDKLEGAVQKEKAFTVYLLEKAPIEQSGEYYSSYIEVNFSVKDFVSLVRFMFFYGPSSIEVIKPDRVDFSAQDFQDGLVDMADMVHKYSNYIAKKMNKDELDQFYNTLFK